MKNSKCTVDGRTKAARYARNAPRTLMPRPTMYESKKTYNRQRSKKELSTNISEGEST